MDSSDDSYAHAGPSRLRHATTPYDATDSRPHTTKRVARRSATLPIDAGSSIPAMYDGKGKGKAVWEDANDNVYHEPQRFSWQRPDVSQTPLMHVSPSNNRAQGTSRPKRKSVSKNTPGAGLLDSPNTSRPVSWHADMVHNGASTDSHEDIACDDSHTFRHQNRYLLGGELALTPDSSYRKRKSHPLRAVSDFVSSSPSSGPLNARNLRSAELSSAMSASPPRGDSKPSPVPFTPQELNEAFARKNGITPLPPERSLRSSPRIIDNTRFSNMSNGPTSVRKRARSAALATLIPSAVTSEKDGTSTPQLHMPRSFSEHAISRERGQVRLRQDSNASTRQSRRQPQTPLDVQQSEPILRPRDRKRIKSDVSMSESSHRTSLADDGGQSIAHALSRREKTTSPIKLSDGPSLRELLSQVDIDKSRALYREIQTAQSIKRSDTSAAGSTAFHRTSDNIADLMEPKHSRTSTHGSLNAKTISSGGPDSTNSAFASANGTLQDGTVRVHFSPSSDHQTDRSGLSMPKRRNRFSVNSLFHLANKDKIANEDARNNFMASEHSDNPVTILARISPEGLRYATDVKRELEARYTVIYTALARQQTPPNPAAVARWRYRRAQSNMLNGQDDEPAPDSMSMIDRMRPRKSRHPLWEIHSDDYDAFVFSGGAILAGQTANQNADRSKSAGNSGSVLASGTLTSANGNARLSRHLSSDMSDISSQRGPYQQQLTGNKYAGHSQHRYKDSLGSSVFSPTSTYSSSLQGRENGSVQPRDPYSPSIASPASPGQISLVRDGRHKYDASGSSFNLTGLRGDFNDRLGSLGSTSATSNPFRTDAEEKARSLIQSHLRQHHDNEDSAAAVRTLLKESHSDGERPTFSRRSSKAASLGISNLFGPFRGRRAGTDTDGYRTSDAEDRSGSRYNLLRPVPVLRRSNLSGNSKSEIDPSSTRAPPSVELKPVTDHSALVRPHSRTPRVAELADTHVRKIDQYVD